MLGYCQVAFLCTAADTQQQQQRQSVHASTPQDPALQQQQQGNAAEVLLWGCDFVPWPTPDLAMSRLFEAAQRLSFDAAAGRYVTCQQQRQQQQQQQHMDRLQVPVQRSAAVEDSCCTEMGPATVGSSSCYVCLHTPAAVLSQDQLTTLEANSSGAKPGSMQLQGAAAAAGCDVLVCLDARCPTTTSSPQSSSQTQHNSSGKVDVASCSVGAAVSGLLVCCANGGMVRALSCLSDVVGSLG